MIWRLWEESSRQNVNLPSTLQITPTPPSKCDCSQMVKVILTHLGCFDPKPLLTDPPHKSSNWFCHCRPQPLCRDSESKLKLFQAARVADSQRSWKHFLMLTISASDLLLMGCTPTLWAAGGGPCLIRWDRNGSLFPFKEMMKFANYLICSCIPLAFAESLCGSPFQVYLAVILAALVLRRWIGSDSRRYPPLSSCEVTAVKHCHGGVTEEQKCD